MAHQSRKMYTAEERQYIIKNINKLSHADMAAVLGRTSRSIQMYCYTHRILKSGQKIPSHDMATKRKYNKSTPFNNGVVVVTLDGKPLPEIIKFLIGLESNKFEYKLTS